MSAWVPTIDAAAAPAATVATTADKAVPSQPAHPEHVVVPAIGVSADLVDLGLNPDRTLQTPTDFDTAGWFTGGTVPGSSGPAVIAGHVDSTDGPAVFYRLAELHPGDTITVDLSDDTTARFTVTDVKQYAKDAFPAGDVYRWVDRPALRLITCGGVFDSATGHYRDNIVVYADLVAPDTS